MVESQNAAMACWDDPQRVGMEIESFRGVAAPQHKNTLSFTTALTVYTRGVVHSFTYLFIMRRSN
jgi:hypothetical protein